MATVSFDSSLNDSCHDNRKKLGSSIYRSHTWVGTESERSRDRNRNYASNSTLTASAVTFDDEVAVSSRRAYTPDKVRGGGVGRRDTRLDARRGDVRRRNEKILLDYWRSCNTDYGYHSNTISRSQTAPTNLFKLSEDGRTPLLPPLGADSTDSSNGRFRRRTTTTSKSGSLEEIMLPRTNRRTNLDVDRKIVVHLRRQLNRRLERRISLMVEKELENTDFNIEDLNQQEDDFAQEDGSSDPRHQRGRVFSLTTQRSVELENGEQVTTQGDADRELKERLDRLDSDMNRPSTSDELPPIIEVSATAPQQPVEDASRSATETDRLPEIDDEALVSGSGSAAKQEADLPDDPNELDQQSVGIVKDDEEAVGPEDNDDNDDSLRPEAGHGSPTSTAKAGTKLQDAHCHLPEIMNVSPVSTPYMARPETRDMARLRTEERVERIVAGSISTPYIPDMRTVNIFINANCTDSDGERSAVLARVRPALHGVAASCGYGLRIVDPHWGVRDLSTDEHMEEQLIVQLIEKTQNGPQRGLNFVSFLGQKYGEPLVPALVDKEEFEAILEAAEEDYRREVEAAAAAAAAAAKRQEAEAKKREERRISRRLRELEEQVEDQADLEGQQTHERHAKEERKSSKDNLTVPPREKSVTFESDVRQKGNTDQAKETGAMGGALAEPRLTRERLGELKMAAKQAGREQLAAKAMRREYSSAGEHLAEPSLLRSWYQLDTNIVPPKYKLHNISSHYKDFIRNDGNKRQAARQQWLQTAAKLQRMFSTYSSLLFDSLAAKKYHTSLMEVELQFGLLWSLQDPHTHTFWFRREIEDLQHHLADPQSRDYADVHAMSSQQNAQLVHALTELKDVKIEKILPKECVWKYPVNWSHKGVSLSSSRSHAIYLDRMCREFYNVVTHRLIDAYRKEATQPDMTSDLGQEVVQHALVCQRRARSFHGRKDLLQTLKTYFRSGTGRPLVVQGKVGTGKTALLCKAAKDTSKWLPGKNAAVVFRTVGATSSSTNLRLLLRDICRQLVKLYSTGDNEAVPIDHKGIVNDFNFRLTTVPRDSLLVLFIDGVNWLLDEQDARKMAWLPRSLPPNVRLVVSTVPDESSQCYPALLRLLPGQPDAFVDVPDVSDGEARAILGHWLRSANRALTDDQMGMIMGHVAKCPRLLYMRLLHQEALRWPSFLPVNEIKLAPTIGKMAVYVFGRLERTHGEPLARRALGYLTAARGGVADDEMEDLLSLDDAVLDDVVSRGQAHITLRRIPPLLWLRMRHDLESYVTEAMTDGVVTLRWFHEEFNMAATERYLNQRDKAPSYHKLLAEYFGGMWSSQPKPTPKEAGPAQPRHVVPQPLYWELPGELAASAKDAASARRYNLRRLNELPYHLLLSQQFDLLKKECLCNYDFLLAKLTATSLRHIFDDLQMALTAEPTDGSLRLLSDTLSLSAAVLNTDPRQLGSQILGRLHQIVSSDKPVAPADPVKYPYLKPLFRQILQSTTTPTLVPSTTCLTPPGGILFDLLYGHTEAITAVTATPDGQRAVTTSLDDTLKVWDLRSSRVTRTICGVGARVLSIRATSGSGSGGKTGSSDALAVTSEVDRIRVWSLTDGALWRDIGDYDDPAAIAVAAEVNLLAAFFDGCRMLRVFDLAAGSGIALRLEAVLDDEEASIHKDRSALVSANTHGACVLYAYRSGSAAYVRNIKTGQRVYRFAVSGSATAVATTREYYVVAVRLRHQKFQEICQLVLFDLGNGQLVRHVRGCTADSNITELHVNQLGSHALAVCTSTANNTSDIAVWNVETEDHKHLARHAGVSHCGACVDVRYFLTAAAGESAPRIWNLSTRMNQPAPKVRALEGVERLIPLPDHPQYVMAKSLLNGPLNVWNVTKNRYVGMVVRSVSGIMDVSDVLIVKGTTLVILTEKGFSNVSATVRPVYQTILVYNLVEGKFVRKITGCFIVPSQAHEYVILDGDLLLGLSDTRGHFVAWNLNTGHVSFRIKTSFKSLDDDDNDTGDYGLGRRKQLVMGAAARRRDTTAKMSPWDRRAETQTARQRRHLSEEEEERRRQEALRKEKENGVEQFLISRDQRVLVASYYSHHLCVLDLVARVHTQTLENENSLLLLHVAALTGNGSHVVHTNYDDEAKTSYLTLWDCAKGVVKRRLRNEKNVCCVAITDSADRVVFGKANGELRVWHPMRAGGGGGAGADSHLYRIKGHPGLDFGGEGGSAGAAGEGAAARNGGNWCQIQLTGPGGRLAVVVAAKDVSVWDLEAREVLAVFTPDMAIQDFTIALEGRLMAFGLRERPDVITLRLLGVAQRQDNESEQLVEAGGKEQKGPKVGLFGEPADSSSDEEDEEDENGRSDSDD